MNNLQQLLALKERYDVGNRELLIFLKQEYRATNAILAEISGYSYAHITNMTSIKGVNVTDRTLKTIYRGLVDYQKSDSAIIELIASALAVKYPRK